MEMMKNQKDVKRCYAKYVYLDVVQFSKRSAEAQSEIVQSLNEIVHDVLGHHEVNEDEDCILIPTGDGMCIALTSTDLSYDIHIQIALSVLGSVDLHNKATENETRQFQVRIGINQNTDILITDINGRKNIAGAGINVASRIMDKADGGQILVSQAVYHELQPSEVYMDRFRKFDALGKHNIRFQVHQYSDEKHHGLNRETPSAFSASSSPKEKLSEQTAHYFAQAILHKQDLLKIKARPRIYWDGAAFVLLRLLATDAYRTSNASEFDDPPTMHTHGAGRLSFEEQYDYYASQDSWVLGQAENHIADGDDPPGLSRHSECFEYGDWTRHYEFVNAEGIKRLKEEWPTIWDSYGLEKFV